MAQWALSTLCRKSWHRVGGDLSLSLYELPPQAQGIATRMGADLTGSSAWEGAKVLSQFISTNSPQLRAAGPSVIELGAGLGLAGLSCAKMGWPRVRLTDRRPSFFGAPSNVLFKLMSLNADLNGLSESVEISKLEWGEHKQIEQLLADNEGGYDLILGADLLYNVESFPVLLQTIGSLQKNDGSSTVLLSQAFQQERFVSSFRSIASEHGYHLEQIHTQGIASIVTLWKETRESWRP